MSTPHRLRLALVFFLPSLVCAFRANAQVEIAQSEPIPKPQAQEPTRHPSPAADALQGLINLDVVVTDKSGKPISGLAPKDFSLLDNGQRQKILSSHGFDGISAKPDPPVEVILLVDTLSIPAKLALLERAEVERFLRQNRGHLAQPVSVFGLSDFGLWTLTRPSGNGNALAAEIAKNELTVIRRRALSRRPGDTLEPLDIQDPPRLTALKALGDIATVERRKPGRKLLVWVGPGWGVGSGADFNSALTTRQILFDTIYFFSTLLREARIALYSFSVGENDPDPGSLVYLNFLNGVDSVQQASPKNLDRRVLAVESGGRVLVPSNDLVAQIDSCIQESSAFYTLSFDPSRANHPGEYHSLKVQVDEPGLTARTNTGYYDQPYYSDQPSPAAKRVTVAQLEQMLGAARSESDAEMARQLSALDLTERLSGTNLSSWTASFRGKKSRQALVALADASAFLEPPSAEVPADAPPDPIAQRRIISLAADYLSNTIPNLPNFYANRTTVRYEEIPQYSEGNIRVDYQPLHVAESSHVTVLYRNGKEVVDSGEAKPRKEKAEARNLITYGTFGPILRVVTDAIAANLTWSHWEQGVGGPRAVFHYVIPAEKSRYLVGGCCLPDGDGTRVFQNPGGYHGEIAIDPASGAILRLEVVADLQSTTPLVRSDIMIEYGPVEIGGTSYICPVRSVSIWRARSVIVLTEWDDSFRSFGPYATMLNDVTFDHYHAFRVAARILAGSDAPSEQKSPGPNSAHPPPAVSPPHH